MMKVREILNGLCAALGGARPERLDRPAGGGPAEAHGYRGRPRFDATGCVGCGACARVCPARAITVTDLVEARRRRLVLDLGRCVFCGACQRACITGRGIRLTAEFDAAHSDRRGTAGAESVEKELVLCERHRAAPVGCREHLAWTAARLGVPGELGPNPAGCSACRRTAAAGGA